MQTQVKKMRERAGLTQKQLAEKLGTSQQSVYYYESGDRDIKASVLIDLSRILKCTVSELLGIGRADISIPESNDGSFKDVPLYGSIAAGTPIDMIEINETHPVPTALVERHPDAFLLMVKGTSMNRLLPNGSYALVDPCNEAIRCMCKRLQRNYKEGSQAGKRIRACSGFNGSDVQIHNLRLRRRRHRDNNHHRSSCMALHAI